MARAHRQVSIVVFQHIWNFDILSNQMFSRRHTYLGGTQGRDSVQCWDHCFQVDVFTRTIVSTQRAEGIHRWTKEGCLKKRKKLNDIFDALMVIVGGLIVKWERLTTGSFCARHNMDQSIFSMPYEAMKDRLTTWERDEDAHQMLLVFQYDMKHLDLEKYERLPRPVADDTTDSTMAVEDLLELDLPPTMATAPPNAVIVEVSKWETGVAHYILLSEPTRTSWMGQIYT